LAFPPDLRGVPCGAGPRSLAIPGSSSRQLSLLSRVRRRSFPVRRCVPSDRLPEVFLSFATSALGVHWVTGFSSPVYVPPSVFRTLSTVCSPTCLAGVFHPAAASEISLQGFSPMTSRDDSSPSRAFLPFLDVHLQSSKSIAPASAAVAPRLRTGHRSVATDRCVTPADSPIPS